MSGFGRCKLLIGGILVVLGTGSAWAQENVEAGKTPAQLYASDCAICHKTPQGLTKGGGIFGLTSFLREHYTASRESAAAIAQYLKTVDHGPAAPAAAHKRTATKPSRKDEKSRVENGKPGEKRRAGAKSPEAKSPEAKSSETKPSETKSSETKPAETKPAEAKPAEAKPAQTAPETKPSDSKPAESKPADSKPPADSTKSD